MNSAEFTGALASRWQTRRLKHSVHLKNDRVEGSASDPEYIGMENIESWTGRLVQSTSAGEQTDEESTTGVTNHFTNGDVLFGKLRPYLAKAWHADRDGKCSTELLVLKANGDLDERFLSYVLLSSEFITIVDSSTFGSKMPRADWESIGNVRIPMPPKATQRRIADYLDEETTRIDALVRAKQDMLALLEKKRAALTIQAVTKGLDPKVKMKDSASEWLGEIPQHWGVRRCATLFKEEDIRGEPDLPVLSVSLNTGVTVREFSESKIERVASDFNTYKVARKDRLAFNKMRFWQGAAGIVPEDGLVSSDYTVAAISNLLLPQYVLHLVRLPRFNDEVRRNSHGMVDDRLRLYWDGFRDIQIPVPPIEEQEAIVAHLSGRATERDQITAELNKSLQLLTKRRNALITAVVTGQVGVPEVVRA